MGCYPQDAFESNSILPPMGHLDPCARVGVCGCVCVVCVCVYVSVFVYVKCLRCDLSRRLISPFSVSIFFMEVAHTHNIN